MGGRGGVRPQVELWRCRVGSRGVQGFPLFIIITLLVSEINNYFINDYYLVSEIDYKKLGEWLYTLFVAQTKISFKLSNTITQISVQSHLKNIYKLGFLY